MLRRSLLGGELPSPSGRVADNGMSSDDEFDDDDDKGTYHASWRLGQIIRQKSIASVALATIVFVVAAASLSGTPQRHLTASASESFGLRTWARSFNSDDDERARTCPVQVDQAKNFVTSFEEYSSPAQRGLQNFDAFVKNYQNETFDAWKRTYQQVKDGMHHWKKTRFVPNIKSGDKLYESACGVGLNLIMTLEILQEAGIQDITIFGNEYMPESVQLGDQLWDALLPRVKGHKGKICHGDSMNLSHLPDNYFDLVYTGYISDLYDPLQWKINEDEDDRRYKELCKSDVTSDWRADKLLQITEERQTEWKSQWVKEMIRIAKPGAAIIVEQVRGPRYCKARDNVFGLTKDWWPTAAKQYGWDVDPNSFDYEDDVLFHQRYHVAMKKKARLAH